MTAKRWTDITFTGSVTSDVDYVDYYDTSNSKQYVDNTVIDGVTYYYRIAAVDKAGNDGELSSIISGLLQEDMSQIMT